MESLVKPKKPYNLDDPKASRKIRAYYGRLKQRLEGNFELSTEEKQDLVQIGLLIATHDKQQTQEQKLQEALDKALDQAVHHKEHLRRICTLQGQTGCLPCQPNGQNHCLWDPTCHRNDPQER